jgi:hypothetical protein
MWAGIRTYRMEPKFPDQRTDDELRWIRVPALLLTGRHSALISPRQARDRASLMPNARAEVITAPGMARAWSLRALIPLRLRRRRCAAGQVIGGGGHRGVAAVAVEPEPQLPDLGRQRHHVGPQFPDRRGLLLQYAGLLPDHRVPGGARRAPRRRRRQSGHNTGHHYRRPAVTNTTRQAEPRKIGSWPAGPLYHTTAAKAVAELCLPVIRYEQRTSHWLGR